MTFRAKTLAALRGDQPLLRGLLDSGRRMLAALLLILPGIVSDVIALLLLLLPINLGAPFAAQSAGRPEWPGLRRATRSKATFAASNRPALQAGASGPKSVGCVFPARQ